MAGQTDNGGDGGSDDNGCDSDRDTVYVQLSDAPKHRRLLSDDSEQRGEQQDIEREESEHEDDEPPAQTGPAWTHYSK